MALTPVEGIVRIDLVSRDPQALARFYAEALDFEPAPTPGPASLDLRLGEQRVRLLRPASPGRPYPAEVPGWDLAFQHFAIVVSDMDDAWARLRGRSDWTPVSTGGPQTLPPSSGGVAAFKFRDPEGHPLELLAFPPDAAPPRWRRGEARQLFLGVDHSAISASDAQNSERFYEQLGFAVTGRSLNRGVEQERLDGVANAVVDVVSLSSAPHPTPHLELLCYRGAYPRRRDPVALDDIAATRLALALPAGQQAQEGLIRDPDGHWLALESAKD